MVSPKIKEHISRFIGDIDPNIIVEKYRQIYPDYSPTDVFFAATTAIRTWKGMVIETERRAKHLILRVELQWFLTLFQN